MKLLLVTIVILYSHQMLSQFLAFDFAGAIGSEASFPSNSNHQSVQSSSISRGSGLTTANNANRFNSESWAITSSIELTDYLEFAVTPVSGYVVRITDFVITSQRSSAGPQSFVIRTSLDGYAANATNIIAISTTAIVNTVFILNTPMTTTTPVIFRIYGYGASGASGSWGPGEGSGNDIIVNGPGNTLLAVKFGNFKVYTQPSGTVIEWSNMTESAINFYSIERSENGNQFSVISQIQARNNNGGKSDYTYIDKTPLSRICFYRIKAVEYDSKIIFSPVLKIGSGNSDEELIIYPNPCKVSNVFIQFSNPKKGRYILKTFSAIGQQVYDEVLNYQGGSLSQLLRIPSTLKPGVYYLQIRNKEMSLEKRFVIE